MTEESSHRHHHHHSSGSHRSHGFSRRHSHRHSRHRGVDDVQERRRAAVDGIITENIGMLRAVLHRRILTQTFTAAIGAAALFFLLWSRHHEGSLLRAAIASLVSLAVCLAAIAFYRVYMAKVIEMKELVQFQESRIDSYKILVSQKEKEAQRNASLGKGGAESGGEGESEGPDYRKLSGLS
ncbi:MAG: hypothetical protein J6S42_08180 [Thermoguttaceae bacterium]|nr:hypothetical protein [Thermoguttaceae bacterium]